MKKVISVLLILMLLFSITGCSANKKAAEEEAILLAEAYYSVFLDAVEDEMRYDDTYVTLFLLEPIIDKITFSQGKYMIKGTVNGGGTINISTPITWVAIFELELEQNNDGTFEVIDSDFGAPEII